MLKDREGNSTRLTRLYQETSTMSSAGCLQSHGPVCIIGDDQLIEYFKGNSSNGSISNPFILENFSIDASNSIHGIEIKNTSLYIHIRNNAITNASNPAYSSKLPSGIILSCVKNVIISNNTIMHNYIGIFINNTSNVILIHNLIDNDFFIGVGINFSSSISLVSNSFINCGLHVLGTLTDCLSINVDGSNKINGIGRIYYYKNLKRASICSFLDGSEVILVNCTGVTISGLKSFSSSIGIMLLYSDNNIIHDNVIINQNYQGLVCARSNNNSIKNNILTGSYYSLGALSCSGCRFEGNQVRDAIFDGLVILSCNDTIVSRNTFDDNKKYGIKVVDSMHIDIQDNVVKESEFGVGIAWNDDHVNISRNTISNCSQYGIAVDLSRNVVVNSNTIRYCNVGLRISQMTGPAMVYLNNFFNSTISHVDLWMLSPACWNGTIWGNYWDDYQLIYPVSQKTERGTWVTPYVLGTGDVNVTDNHALVSPNMIPRASFSITNLYVYAGEYIRITFTGDTGDDPATITWSFGDGTSRITTDREILYAYRFPGVYQIVLTITDKHGEQDTASILIYVEREMMIDILPHVLSFTMLIIAIFLLIKKKKTPAAGRI
ncbi:MAG: NosD domain-containing protein [Candidatus Sigynarchaeota archaeon]